MKFNNGYFSNTNNIFNLNLKLKPNQFTILSYLIRMANNTDSCYPSMNNISEMCCVSKSTVTRTIDELSAAGYIKVVKQNKHNVYFINYIKIEQTNRRVNKSENISCESHSVCTEETILSEEEMVENSTSCTREEAKQAIAIATENAAKDRVKYAIAVIRNTKSKGISIINKRNTFNDFPQRQYTKEYFENIERLLLEKNYFE